MRLEFYKGWGMHIGRMSIGYLGFRPSIFRLHRFSADSDEWVSQVLAWMLEAGPIGVSWRRKKLPSLEER